MKIYTKKGDDGTTNLFGGSRVPKYSLRVEAYGQLDELNANLGMLRSLAGNLVNDGYLNHLQILLFDIGSHLATNPDSDQSKMHLPELNDEELTIMEQEIDQMEVELPQLKNFILPAGSKEIAQAHICRTVCRRVERSIAYLADQEPVDSLILSIINRLSDYFFVLARYICKTQDLKEIIWESRNS